MRIKFLIYFSARLFGLFALSRWFTRSHIRILCYHGACVGDEGDYNPLLFLSATTFRRRVRWLLNKGFGVIPLDSAAGALAGAGNAGRLPTVITFDDGWYSTASRLIPVLAENGLPSTLYLCTSHFEDGWPIPMVTVNYMIWKTRYQHVAISGLGDSIDGLYRLDEAAGQESFLQRSCAWMVEGPATREQVVERIHLLAEPLGLSVDDIALQTRRFDYMTNDELLQLAERGCRVELHGHDHRYPVGDPSAFIADLSECRDTIVARGLPEPHHYCYPSGDFDDAAAATLEKVGVCSATTCIPGLVSPAKDGKRRYYLPRFLDGDNISMLTFEAEMSGFAHLLRRALGR